MTKDNLENCPKCGGDACYTTKLNATTKNYFCFGCGFTTNDLMVIGEFDFEQYEETLPELYKDIKVDDGTSRVWYPITINIEDKGTVFAKGTNFTNWMWAGIKVKEVSKEEQEKFKEEKYKADMSTIKHFIEREFIEALSYIGVLPE